MSVTLGTIDKTNWEQCIQLQVAEQQKTMVASNLYSLAESHYEISYVPLAIYAEQEMVGFLMYGRDPDDGQYWIVRLMIDAKHQGKGYGRAALCKAIELLKAKPDCDSILISYKPNNIAAETLYESIGFRKTGDMIHGEVVSRLLFALTDNLATSSF